MEAGDGAGGTVVAMPSHAPAVIISGTSHRPLLLGQHLIRGAYLGRAPPALPLAPAPPDL